MVRAATDTVGLRCFAAFKRKSRRRFKQLRLFPAPIRSGPYAGGRISGRKLRWAYTRQGAPVGVRKSKFWQSGWKIYLKRHDGAMDTFRCADGFVDPLLARLKQVHGDRK